MPLIGWLSHCHQILTSLLMILWGAKFILAWTILKSTNKDNPMAKPHLPRLLPKAQRELMITALAPVVKSASANAFRQVVENHRESELAPASAFSDYSQLLGDYTDVLLQQYFGVPEGARDTSVIKLDVQGRIRKAHGDIHSPARHVLELALDQYTDVADDLVFKAKIAVDRVMRERAESPAR